MRYPTDTPYTETTPYGWVKNYPLHLDGVPGCPPKPGDGYGYHIGIDLVSNNKRVYLVETANIEVVPWDGTSAEGNAVYYTIGTRRVAYCHLKSFAPGLKSRVAGEGTYLGDMGKTGAATGVHLHFATSVNGVYQDPAQYLPISEGEDMQPEIDKLYNSLNETNKRLDTLFVSLDSLYKTVDAQAQTIDKLYTLLDETNKRIDNLEKK